MRTLPGKLQEHFPALTWLPTYSREKFPGDVIAGLTTSAVVIPKAMAYAAVAGLPLEVGLYTSLVPLAVYAVMGSSRRLSVTTTSTIAILTADALAQTDPGGTELMGAAAMLALLVGLFLLLAGLLRLGFLSSFISDPVLTGFKAGIGIVIIMDQIPKLLGLHLDKGTFLANVISLLHNIPRSSLPTLALGLCLLGLIFGLERFIPRLPAPLIGIIFSIALSGALGLGGRGIELVGELRPGLPAFALPDLSLAGKLWPGALGIALMSFVETIAAGRAFVGPGEPRPAADQELLAIGTANLLGSFFGNMPSGGGTSQTAVNSEAGADSQIAGFVTALTVVATLLFLIPLIRLIPQTALAAVVIVTCLGMVNAGEFRTIRQVRTREFWWAIIGTVGVVLLGTLDGILVAVGISLFVLIYEANHPPVYMLGRDRDSKVFRPLTDHPDDEVFPGMLLLRTEGRLHFANAHRVGEKSWALIRQARPEIVVLEMSAVPDVEYTALRMLTWFEKKLREEGISLWLVDLNPTPLAILSRCSRENRLGEIRIFESLVEVIESYQKNDNPVVRKGETHVTE